MKAVVMAGGFGTRLRPLTEKLPKPMAPVANRPMMEHVVRLLAAEGIDDLEVPDAARADDVLDGDRMEGAAAARRGARVGLVTGHRRGPVVHDDYLGLTLVVDNVNQRGDA